MRRQLGLRQYAYQNLIQPGSGDQDERRQEFTVNVIICGLAMVTLVVWLSSVLDAVSGHRLVYGTPLLVTSGFMMAVLGLWWFARRGHHHTAALVVVALLALTTLTLMLNWSFELPQAELTYAAIMVLAAMLLKPRTALLTGALAVLALLILAGLQVSHVLQPRTDWLNQKPEMADAIGFITVFAVIELVAWLSNREIDQSLKRARASEAALAKERNGLERKVRQRTAELEHLQLTRTLELQRFAEFGRLSAELLHDLSNPLMAASLNVAQLDSAEHADVITQIKQNLQHLSRYIEAARKQLKGHSRRMNFSVRAELAQVQSMILPQAKKLGVQLEVNLDGNYRLYGDPVKFNQLIANLIINALEAYVGVRRSRQRRVVINVTAESQWLTITVTDWGQGIKADHLPRLFEPFFSTKLTAHRGLGIGLATVKECAETEFRGNITVSSVKGEGTKFIVRLRNEASAPTKLLVAAKH